MLDFLETPQLDFYTLISVAAFTLASFIAAYTCDPIQSLTFYNFLTVIFQSTHDIRYNLLILILFPLSSVLFLWFCLGFFATIFFMYCVFPIIRAVLLAFL